MSAEIDSNVVLPPQGNEAIPAEPFMNEEKEKVVETTIAPDEMKEEEKKEGKEDESSNNMALNVAFEALEQVRIANVQVEFAGLGGSSSSTSTGRRDFDKECLFCLREELKENLRNQFGCGNNKQSKENSNNGGNESSVWNRFSDQVQTQVQKARQRQKTIYSCLTCGTTVCYDHKSPNFRRDKHISICNECSNLFSKDYIMKIVMESNTNADSKAQVNSMLDVYDRSLLILKYSSQYIDDIKGALQSNTRRHNHMELGSNMTGVISGITGVVAAGLIFTPAGPPLLVASILFGGSATAASAGSDAINYHCEPNKMADKIITLHAMISSISQLPLAIATMNRRKNNPEEPIEEPEQQQPQEDIPAMNGANDASSSQVTPASLWNRFSKMGHDEKGNSNATNNNNAQQEAEGGEKGTTPAPQPFWNRFSSGRNNSMTDDNATTATTTTTDDENQEGQQQQQQQPSAPKFWNRFKTPGRAISSSSTRSNENGTNPEQQEDDGNNSTDGAMAPTTKPVIRTTQHWTKGTMYALRPLTLGALSAISIVTETREMKNTLNKIYAGNPCEKVELLNEIQNDIQNNLKETNVLAEYVQTIMEHYSNYPNNDEDGGDQPLPEQQQVEQSQQE